MPDDLYALPPEEFTAARDAAVKQARAGGDRPRAKELAALRRPTASAHLVNLLVRSEPDLVGQLLDLGQRLALAQESGRGADLRALGGQRRALVQALTDRAVEGHDVTTPVRTEVETTLDAALADPGAAEAVRSGRLVRALSYAGFGTADVSGAVAPGPAPTTPKGDTAAAERAAQEAAGRLDDAVRALDRAQQAEDDAVDAVTAAVDAETEAEQALAAARAARERAEAESGQRAEVTEQAAEQVRTAQDAAEQARAALDRRRRGF